MYKTIFTSGKGGGYKESLQRYSDLSTTASDYQKGSPEGAYIIKKLVLITTKLIITYTKTILYCHVHLFRREYSYITF